MKNVFKSKRGIALESAILFMAVLATFSILLTSVVTSSHVRVKASQKTMENRLMLEQIGEYFLSDTPESNLFEEALAQSGAVREDLGNDNLLLLKRSSDGKELLYVERAGDGTALAWKYTANQ